MDDQAVRLECLRLAAARAVGDHDVHHSVIIQAATAYMKFVQDSRFSSSLPPDPWVNCLVSES